MWALMELYGGLNSMVSAIDQFEAVKQGLIDSYKTDAEKQADALSAVNEAFDKLGMAAPKTVAEFRSLAESADVTTSEGRALINTMDGIKVAFDEVIKAGDNFGQDFTAMIDGWYRDIIGRAPDAEGAAWWNEQLTTGAMTPEDAENAFRQIGARDQLEMQILELTNAEAYLQEVRARELSLLDASLQPLAGALVGAAGRKRGGRATGGGAGGYCERTERPVTAALQRPR